MGTLGTDNTESCFCDSVGVLGRESDIIGVVERDFVGDINDVVIGDDCSGREVTSRECTCCETEPVLFVDRPDVIDIRRNGVVGEIGKS